MTGPKNATPSGGWKWMIGVPTSLPVSESASSVSRRSSASKDSSSSASASSGGRPASASAGSTNSRVPRYAGSLAARVGRGVEDPGADRGIERADRGAAVLGPRPGGDAEQPQARGVAGFVPGGEVAVVVDAGVDHAAAR